MTAFRGNLYKYVNFFFVVVVRENWGDKEKFSPDIWFFFRNLCFFKGSSLKESFDITEKCFLHFLRIFEL